MSPAARRDTIVVLDFGGQFCRLIARRVRESRVYCEILPWDVAPQRLRALQPKGIILSGGPSSVYDADAPYLQDVVLELGVPVLGICYGMQLLAQKLGGRVVPHDRREHRIVGVQFHPEVAHTPQGLNIIQNFCYTLCGCDPSWTPGSFIAESVGRIREQVGDGRVLCGVSGGVDSSVAAALIHKAVGDQLTCVFVDHGLLRKDEGNTVVRTFKEHLGFRLSHVDASEDFLEYLSGVADPEQKRQVVGERFVRAFEREAHRLEQEEGPFDFLAQGTLYPDVIESAVPGGDHKSAAKICPSPR